MNEFQREMQNNFSSQIVNNTTTSYSIVDSINNVIIREHLNADFINDMYYYFADLGIGLTIDWYWHNDVKLYTIFLQSPSQVDLYRNFYRSYYA